MKVTHMGALKASHSEKAERVLVTEVPEVHYGLSTGPYYRLVF